MSQKFYNPKSRSPAVYIECWLIQVPTSLLSNNAKMFYGRLSQWCNSTGDVYRSLPQLAEELGTPARTLERHLKELRDVGLIETYQPQAGGVNHYKFLYHPWMDEPINDNLVYKSDPPSNMRVPPRNSDGTPPSDLRYINKKEIKESACVRVIPPEPEISAVPIVSPTSNNTHTRTDFLNIFDLFSNYGIPCPESDNPYANKLIAQTIQILAENNLCLDRYLEYLVQRCAKWIYEPWRDGRTTDFYTILKKENLIKGIEGAFEDHK